MGLHVTTSAIKQTTLVAENFTSDAPRIWCDQYLLRILTKRSRNTIFPFVKTEDFLESVPPLPRPRYLESQKDLAPLWRMEFLHPNPRLKHITLREDNTGYGGCDYG